MAEHAQWSFCFLVVLRTFFLFREFVRNSSLLMVRGGSSLPMFNFTLSSFSLTMKTVECLLRMFSIYGLVFREAQVILQTLSGDNFILLRNCPLGVQRNSSGCCWAQFFSVNMVFVSSPYKILLLYCPKMYHFRFVCLEKNLFHRNVKKKYT